MVMQACIHRGSREIGGSCVELEHEGDRIVLDLGAPLDAPLDNRYPLSLPPVAGLTTGDPYLHGVMVTHGHPDHYGLVAGAHPSLPVYLGEATQRILQEAAFFSPTGTSITAADYLRDRHPMQIGPFRVTPYLVDHSAFDAYALLVEAGGRRLLYSGDLRAHGRKRALVERLIRNPPHDVDALLLEGTTIGRPTDPGSQLSEADVEDRCVELFGRASGMILTAYSGQNIDRLVTLHRAARRSGRTLVLDLYTASIARATGQTTIPQGHWDTVRVFVPLSQRIRVKNAREFDRVAEITARRIYSEELTERAGDLVMTFRASMTADLERASCLAGAEAVWSMWSGYLENPAGVRLRAWLDAHSIRLTMLHASGHAQVEDLQRFALAIDATQIVPIHTRHPERYADLFENVVAHDDGDWWAL